MEEFKISDLTEATEVTDDDLVEVVIDTDTTPKSRKMKRSTLVDDLATAAEVENHVEDTDNPHGVTKAQVGLSNVPNTDATDRSNHTGTQAISTVSGLQTALDGKAATSHTHIASQITDFDTEVSNNTDVAGNTSARHTHSNASVLNNTTASFTTDDETKLDGIEENATENSSDATLLNRANHTGAQAISTITGLQTALDGKAPSSHTHDDRYYTETETDALLADKADDDSVVHDTGNETIAGIKTFSSSPIVPTPTTDMQAATKKYVDDELAAFTPGDSLPDQTGNSGKFLTTDGTDPSWGTPGGGGDMQAATYDPTNVAGDAFDMDNMVEGDSNKILTASERSSIASAVQPGDLAAVATSGDYDDLSNTPSLGTAAATDTGDFASAAQGSLADSATQPGDNISTLTNDAGFTSNAGTVTSVGVSGSDGIEVESGSPISSTGTIALGINAASLRSHINVEDGADVTDATNVAAAGAVMESDTSTASMGFVVDEDDMSSNSATKVPTQQSVKAYVDASAGPITRVVGIQVSGADELVSGDGQAFFRVPSVMNGYELTAVAAHVADASSSGGISIQVHNVTGAADMLTTPLTIDAGENDSSTAATAAVIDTSEDDVATGDWIRLDIDGAGADVTWLFIELQFSA